jgi:hypothetical protein
VIGKTSSQLIAAFTISVKHARCLEQKMNDSY